MSSVVKVFIPDNEHVWLTGDLLTETDETGSAEVSIDDPLVEKSNRKINMRKLPFGLTSLPLQNPELSSSGVEDMCSLGFLHEASILDNLRRRFETKLPYTYTGEICIAVNPYQWLDLYSASLRDLYSHSLRHDQSPHVYSTSAAAYRGLRDRGRNQSILVSGESGAGKTETVKILMDHLASSASQKGDRTISKVLRANPLLESFGNAKTVRNDNSSRFGKFTELQFDDNCFLVGSKCITYLLEKSRVVSQSSVERNYHVLYQLLESPSETRDSLFLSRKTRDHFHYLSQGDPLTSTIEGISDADRFQMTSEALALLGVSSHVRQQLLEGLSGILYLGQVRLLSKEGNDDEASLLPDDPASGETSNQTCCRLLGLETEHFSTHIVTRSLDVEGSKLSVPLSQEQAITGRDALAKEIYERIFQWLVHVINFNTMRRTISSSSSSTSLSSSSRHSSSRGKSIALLDIFGFESFQINRFEQLCINLANEKLQQKFTQDVFKTVQNEYRDEGLEWEAIGFVDNAETLDLIEGSRGILSSLNEECLVPKGSDSSFLTKIKKSCASFPSFSINLTSRDEFTITHYAGKVSYNINGFLERNKDALPEDMRTLMAASSNPLLSNIFSNPQGLYGNSAVDSDHVILTGGASVLMLDESCVDIPDPSSSSSSSTSSSTSSSSEDNNSSSPRSAAAKKSRRSSFMMAESVTIKFKAQLTSLMDTIGLTEVQYVRCIKPNRNKSPIEFNRLMVVEQLRSAGMVEAIRISRAAYPYRLTYQEFLSRFGSLQPPEWHRSQDHLYQSTHPPQSIGNNENSEEEVGKIEIAKNRCNLLLHHLLPSHVLNPPRPPPPTNTSTQTTSNQTGKSLPSSSDSPKLNLKPFELGKTKLYFSNGVLEHLESLRTQIVNLKVREIQRIYRGLRKKRIYVKMKRMVLILQRQSRRWRELTRYHKTRSAIILMQSVVRMKLARSLLKRLKSHRSATLIQCVHRRHRACYLYQRMRSSSILIQSLVRMRNTRKRFVVLRDKARHDAQILNQLSNAQSELIVEKEKNSALESELNQLRSQLTEREGIVKSQIERMELELARVTTEAALLPDLQTRISELTEREQSIQKDRDSSRQELQQLTEKFELKSHEYLKLEEEIARLTQQHARETSELESRFSLELTSAQNNIQELKHSLSTQETELSSLRANPSISLLSPPSSSSSSSGSTNSTSTSTPPNNLPPLNAIVNTSSSINSPSSPSASSPPQVDGQGLSRISELESALTQERAKVSRLEKELSATQLTALNLRREYDKISDNFNINHLVGNIDLSSPIASPSPSPSPSVHVPPIRPSLHPIPPFHHHQQSQQQQLLLPQRRLEVEDHGEEKTLERDRVVDQIHSLEGLSSMVYMAGKTDSQVTGKPTRMRKTGVRIECEIIVPVPVSVLHSANSSPSPSPPSAELDSNTPSSPPRPLPVTSSSSTSSDSLSSPSSSNPPPSTSPTVPSDLSSLSPKVFVVPPSTTISHTLSAASKKFRFKLTDLRRAQKGKGTTVKMPSTLDDSLCLHLAIEGKGELNLVMESVEKRDAVVAAFSMWIPNPSQSTPTTTPIATPVSSPTKHKPAHSSPLAPPSSQRVPSLSPSSSLPIPPVTQGWVFQDGASSGAGAGSGAGLWYRRYCVLDSASKHLKLGYTDSLLLSPSQITVNLPLQADMSCSVARESVPEEEEEDRFVVEIFCPRIGPNSFLRFRTGNKSEASNWETVINSTIQLLPSAIMKPGKETMWF